MTGLPAALSSSISGQQNPRLEDRHRQPSLDFQEFLDMMTTKMGEKAHQILSNSSPGSETQPNQPHQQRTDGGRDEDRNSEVADPKTSPEIAVASQDSITATSGSSGDAGGDDKHAGRPTTSSDSPGEGGASGTDDSVRASSMGSPHGSFGNLQHSSNSFTDQLNDSPTKPPLASSDRKEEAITDQSETGSLQHGQELSIAQLQAMASMRSVPVT